MAGLEPDTPAVTALTLHQASRALEIGFADGSVFRGTSIGADGITVGEVVFNTAMTGYQEIMTDPSYAGQVVTFTFPHIGNVGANPEDDEAAESFRDLFEFDEGHWAEGE